LRALTSASPDVYTRTDKGEVQHPWIAEQVDELRSALLSGRAHICSHLRRRPQPGFAFVQDVSTLRCGRCVVLMPPLSAVEDETCDRCERWHRDGLWSSAVAVGSVVLFVALCDRCHGETDHGEPELAA
jgi:hypothetical protein